MDQMMRLRVVQMDHTAPSRFQSSENFRKFQVYDARKYALLIARAQRVEMDHVCANHTDGNAAKDGCALSDYNVREHARPSQRIASRFRVSEMDGLNRAVRGGRGSFGIRAVAVQVSQHLPARAQDQPGLFAGISKSEKFADFRTSAVSCLPRGATSTPLRSLPWIQVTP